ncbi:MraY family glycosyltransferase [Piscinibacter sakaiensis]|uniref:MraY family glycosyltransferase n=1 Tax=Piscinibacter sakaiensis TaxID=1547922 RepID=UPI003AABA487
MNALIFSFLGALACTLLIIKSSRSHGAFSADHDLQGPQKFHSQPVPRIGGVSLLFAMVAGLAALDVGMDGASTASIWLLLLCALPAFIGGLAEDLTKRVSPTWRMVFTAVSAALAIWLLGGVVTRVDLPGVDFLLGFWPIALLATVFAVTGIANSVNIIDGFNGLASMCVMMILAALAYVAFQVGDRFVAIAALLTIGAVLGFFVWNFPAGLIFLGDGGAYLLGFLVAELSVLLLARNPSVSGLFPLLLLAYPIFETVFSIYRKKFLRGVSPGIPDGVHLHMLVYKRLMRWTLGGTGRHKTARNSMTSPYLWVLCMLSVIPAVLFWNNTLVLGGFCLLFMVSYVLLYWRIVRFKAPRWMVVRR